MPDCICVHDPKCKYHEDIAELCPDLDPRTIRVINRALARQRINFEKALSALEEELLYMASKLEDLCPDLN